MTSKERFTRFPNFVYDYIIDSDLTATQLKIVLAVCRNTYGWHKEYCKLSLSELSKLIGCSKSQAVRDVKKLIEHDILTETYQGQNRLLKFNDSITKL